MFLVLQKVSLKRLLRTLSAVFASCLLSLRNACGIERAADDMISYAGQISYSSAADKHGTVFLKVVSFAGNVNRSFLLIRKTYSCDLTKRRVRLFGRSGGYRKANASFLRAMTHDRSLTLVLCRYSALLDELVDSWHFLPPYRFGYSENGP